MSEQTAPPAPAPARRLIRDRYALGRKLGEGAQGTTYEAVDELAGSVVAVKEFHIRGAESWKAVELAEREAQVLASLSHPGLPKYRDHFEESGALYLVVDRIEGDPLRSLMTAGALDQKDVAQFLRDARDILDYLHGRAPPVIHRDIKPSNVIRRPGGSFAIVDFGSVRARLSGDGGSTIVGTFGFMAPEQFQGRALPQSDVYAVGATALAMMTGVAPEDLPHRGLAIDVRKALGSHAPEEIVGTLTRMLDPDPDARAHRVLLLPASADGPRRPRPRPHRGPRHHYPGHHDRRFEHGRKRPRVPPPIALVLETGLTVARVAVALTLLVLVPVLLTLLSLIFSSNLRRSAERVRRAGQRANDALRRAQRSLLRSGPAGWRAPATPPHAEARQEDDVGLRQDEGGAAEGAPRMRVEPEAPTTAPADIDAELEEAGGDDAAPIDRARSTR